jgi:uncharacterized protein YjbI with pentapeptide repeats
MKAALRRLGEQDALDFRGIEFSDSLLSRVLEAFSKEQADRPVFRVYANFISATFAGGADFRRAIFSGGGGFGGATFQGEVWFTGATFQGEIRFTRATFQGDAWFTGATFSDRAYFEKVAFRSDAGFDGATFSRRVEFGGASFQGGTAFRGATIQGNAGFGQATFEQTRQLGPLLVRHELGLDDAVFRQRVRLEVAASKLSCSRTRFLAGVHMRLRWAKVMLEDANLAGPSILSSAPGFADLDEREMLSTWQQETGPPRPGGQPWLASLCRADVPGLAVAGLDLRACRFKGAHNLDQLRLESAKAFATTPGWHAVTPGWRAVKGWAWPPFWWWTGRQTLAEEHAWRVEFERGMVRKADWHDRETWPNTTEHWVPRPSRSIDPTRRLTGAGNSPRKTPSREDVSQRQEQAREIASLYRALRKGYEDNRNEPGAADFYYGEMDLRREATPPSIERVILWLYWLVSGYGLRAWRALAAAVGSLVLGAFLLEGVGIAAPRTTAAGAVGAAEPVDTSFVGALFYSARTVIALPHGPQPALTHWGDVVQIGLRVIVPVLLGLAVLSIRGRVKR